MGLISRVSSRTYRKNSQSIMGRSDSRYDKEEKARQKATMKVTKFLRFNVPSKPHKFNKEEMYCFNGKDALKTLMNSKYYKKDSDETPRHERKPGYFYTKNDAVNFLKQLVLSRMAVRGAKKYKDEMGGVKLQAPDSCCGGGPKIPMVVEEKDKDSERTDTEDKKTDKKSKKRKFKVVYNQQQSFYPESDEIYVWVYNPTPFMHWVYGALVLLVVIGGTLFPLWPDSLRTGVYYGSISLASFIGGILVIGLLRTVLFGLIWACTAGNHHLWILPNLLEDVGFFESFKPGYTWQVKDPNDPKKLMNRSKLLKRLALEESSKADGEDNTEDESKKDE